MSKIPQDSHQAGAAAATNAAGKPSVDLLKDPLWKALLFMALPATIGFVFNTLYNVVDLLYARSWIGPEGTSTQDALSATFPLFFLQLGFGIGLYQGTTALIANAIGRSDEGEARKLTIQAVTYGLLIGLIVAVFGLSILAPTLWAQGLEGTEFDWAVGYMIAVFIGAPLVIANFALYALLSGAGNNRAFGLSLSVAFLLNIGFNYVFMHYLGFGVIGLGIATVLIQGPLNFLYVAYEVRRLGTLKGVTLADFAPDWAYLQRIAGQAIPASLSMLLVAASVLILNTFAGQYADGTLGGLGTAARIEQVLLLPIIGVGVGALAIIGQNQGAGQMDRVRATFWLTTRIILVFTVFAATILALFPTYLASLIASPGREAEVAATYLFYSGFGAVFFGLLYAATAFKTGMRQPVFAAVTNMLRLILLPVTFILIFQQMTPEFVAVPWGILGANILVGVGAYLWVARSVLKL